MSKTFKIFTFGCKTNIQESDYISQELRQNGFEEKSKEEKSSYTIINSCSVTSNADDEILYLIRKQKKKEPDTKIILTGCLAQVDAENLSKNPDIYMVLGNSEKLRIAEFIENSSIRFSAENLLIKTDFDEFNLLQSKRTRATLKIQDGCNNFCSYCIVPFTRGKSRSSKMVNVLNNIQGYISNGYKEIVLSAIHLGLWGLDFNPSLKLVDLLREIEKLDCSTRFRLGSLDPKELDDELIDFLINSKKFCNHLHVSLQSATDKTLQNMNRHYSIAEAKEKLEYLNKNIEYLNIGADVIVGFPQETDEDFQITCENIEAMPFSYMHIFPYSVRKFTKAAQMSGHVDEQIKKQRARILKEIIQNKQHAFLNSLVGTTQKVLVEKSEHAPKLYKGVASNYTKFLIESDKDISNNVVSVQVQEIRDKKLFAKFNNF